MIRSPLMIALGTYLVLAAGALVAVIAAGRHAPLWLIGGWFLLALAVALVVGALVPASPRGPRGRYDRRNGVDPAITGEPREERTSGEQTAPDRASQ